MAYLNFWSEHQSYKILLPTKHSGGPQLELGHFSSLRFFLLTKCDIYKILFSLVINLLLTKLARDRTGRISTLGLFCTDLATLGPYCQGHGPILCQYGPRACSIRYIYICEGKLRALFFYKLLTLKLLCGSICDSRIFYFYNDSSLFLPERQI